MIVRSGRLLNVARVQVVGQTMENERSKEWAFVYLLCVSNLRDKVSASYVPFGRAH